MIMRCQNTFNLFQHPLLSLFSHTAQRPLDHLALLQSLHSLPEDIDDVPQDDTHRHNADCNVTPGRLAHHLSHLSSAQYAEAVRRVL